MSLPTPPLRSDGPATFADRGDAFLAALPQFEIDMNAVGVLAASAVAAAPGAIAAANFKGEYAAGTTYQVGQSVSYGGDTWFAKTVNLGVTPVIGANWQRVVTIPSQTGQTGKVLTTDGSVLSWQDPKVGDHRVSVHSGNGYGSTNTKIRRYTTVKANVGTAIVYADSATLGASFTIAAGHGGLYAISMTDRNSTNFAYFGISKNSAQLTTTIDMILSSSVIFFTQSNAANLPASCFPVVRLSAGDVVRPHTLGLENGTTEAFSNFSITKVGI